MFNNIGGKIKTLSAIICWIGIAFSVIIGISSITSKQVISGILIIVVGSFISWIGSFYTYGFGQLIENTDEIRKRMESANKSSVNQNQFQPPYNNQFPRSY